MIRISLLIFLLFISASSFAQKQSEKEIKNLLCHEWKIDYAKVGDERFPLPSSLGNTFLDIKSNGTVIAGNANKRKKGKWHYDHKTKILTVATEKDPWIFNLVKISATELAMNTTKEGFTMTMYLKRVN